MTRRRPCSIDVLVVGGGPAGCSAAASLARHGLAVTLLERSRYETTRVGETLPPKIGPRLQAIGAGGAFAADAHLPCPGAVSAWATAQPQENDFIFSPYGTGWHLDRRRFDESLAALAREAGVEVHQGADWPNARLAKDASAPRILLDASGRPAVVARSRSVPRTTLDRQVAVIGYGRAAAGADPRTMIEAASSGWWYGARLPEEKAVAAFFTDADLLPRNASQRGAWWWKLLQAAPLVRELLAVPQGVDSLRVVAASTSRLVRFAGDNWLATGDAAMTFDPLSSQGILKAITSGLRSAQAIIDLLAGNESAFAAYNAALEAEFDRYSGECHSYYAQVRRWPDSLYWQRRQEQINDHSPP